MANKNHNQLYPEEYDNEFFGNGNFVESPKLKCYQPGKEISAGKSKRSDPKYACSKSCCQNSSQKLNLPTIIPRSRSKSPDQYIITCDFKTETPCCSKSLPDKIGKNDSTRSLPECNDCTYETCVNPSCTDYIKNTGRSRSADSKTCNTQHGEQCSGECCTNKKSHSAKTCQMPCCKDHDKKPRCKSAESKKARSESDTCLSSRSSSLSKENKEFCIPEFSSCKPVKSNTSNTSISPCESSVQVSDEPFRNSGKSSSGKSKCSTKKNSKKINVCDLFNCESDSEEFKKFACFQKPDWYDTRKPLTDRDLGLDDCEEYPRPSNKKKKQPFGDQKEQKHCKSKIATYTTKSTSRTKMYSDDEGPSSEEEYSSNVAKSRTKQLQKKKSWYSKLLPWSKKSKLKKNCHCSKKTKMDKNHKCISFEDDGSYKDNRNCTASGSQFNISSQISDVCFSTSSTDCSTENILNNRCVNPCPRSQSACQPQQDFVRRDKSFNYPKTCVRNASETKNLWSTGVVPKFPWTLMSSSWVHGQDKSTRAPPYRSPKCVYNPSGTTPVNNSRAFQNFLKYRTGVESPNARATAKLSDTNMTAEQTANVQIRNDQTNSGNANGAM